MPIKNSLKIPDKKMDQQEGVGKWHKVN